MTKAFRQRFDCIFFEMSHPLLLTLVIFLSSLAQSFSTTFSLIGYKILPPVLFCQGFLAPPLQSFLWVNNTHSPSITLTMSFPTGLDALKSTLGYIKSKLLQPTYDHFLLRQFRLCPKGSPAMEQRAIGINDIVRENGDNGEGPGGELGSSLASGGTYAIHFRNKHQVI